MSITERAKDMGVADLVKENKRLKRNWEEEIEACMGWWKKAKELEEENKKLKEERDFFYKSAKQFREQVEKWEKDFVEGRIVEKD